MTPLKSDLLYNQIHTEIMLCILVPNTIFTERDISERYGARKATIRNVMARLIQVGFVQTLPRKGYLVTPVTMQDVSEVCDARIALEPDLTRIATQRLTPTSMQDIALALQETEKNEVLNSRFIYQAANHTFHISIAKATGNERLVQMLDRLLVEHQRIRHLPNGSPHLSPVFAQEHRDLFELMCAGDDIGAAAMVRQQLQRGKEIAIQEVLGNPVLLNQQPVLYNSKVKASSLELS